MQGRFVKTRILFGLRRFYCRLSYHLFKNHPLPPLEIMIEPTHRCNLRCKMCPFLPVLLDNGAVDLDKKEISLEEIKEVIRSVPRFSLISLVGGEPLIREDFLQIVDIITQKNKLTLVTNGTLLTETIAQQIVKTGSRFFWDRGLFLLVFSIHGTEDIHDDICQVRGSFRRALNGLRYVQEAKKRQTKQYPIIYLNCVITKWNYHILSEIFQLAEELKVDFCNFSLRGFSVFTDRLDNDRFLDEDVLNAQLSSLERKAQNSKVRLSFLPQGATSRDIIEYYSRKDKGKLESFFCFAPWKNLIITAYAEVTSCPFFSVGNIRENKISEIWGGKLQHKFRQELKIGIPSFCEKCCFSEKL